MINFYIIYFGFFFSLYRYFSISISISASHVWIDHVLVMILTSPYPCFAVLLASYFAHMD